MAILNFPEIDAVISEMIDCATQRGDWADDIDVEAADVDQWQARLQIATGHIKGFPSRCAPTDARDDESNFSVAYRTGPPTIADYNEAITDLTAARNQLRRPAGKACAICGDSGHQAQTCHHNILILARTWAAATAVYQCWHCGYTAMNEEEGNRHFGLYDGAEPQCIADLTTERDALKAALAKLRKGLDLVDPGRPLQYAEAMDLMRKCADDALISRPDAV